MAVVGAGNGGPFGDVLFIDFTSSEPFGRVPAFFSEQYPTHIPMNAVLLDPLGNVNTLYVEKIGGHDYFTNGWAHFGRYYGMEGGAWVRMTYVRPATFEITIRTRKLVEWIYPPIPEPLEGGFGGAGVNMARWEEELLLANNRLFPFSLVKWVSFSDFTGDTMTVPQEFFGEALINPGEEIYIVDEYGKRWPCLFRRCYGSQSKDGVITRGWARFCRHKRLQQDQKIMFGVTHPKSNNLHFIPIPNV